MGNLTFQQVFRYLLPGGITLLTLLVVYEPNGSGTGKAFDINSLGGAAVLSGIALILGGIAYTLHRAAAYPLIYRVLLLVGPLRVDRTKPRAWIVIWPSEEELERDICRWRKRDDPSVSAMSEWATQIHYLYCSSWVILVGYFFGWQLGWARTSLFTLSLLLLMALLIGGVYHHMRLLRFEAEVLRSFRQAREVAPLV